MLFDLRQYQCRPCTIGKQLQMYADIGYDTQRRHLGDPLFYGVVETGDVNSYVHIWSYEDAADRENRRKALYDDSKWLEYRQMGAEQGWQTSQCNTLLKPAPFWKP